MNELQTKIIEVLSRQSPGYLAAPHAACFIAEGLDPDEVALELPKLKELGYSEALQVEEDILEDIWEDIIEEIFDPETGEKIEDRVIGQRFVEQRVKEKVVVDSGWVVTTKGKDKVPSK